jgi:hypothetical protein
MINLTKLLLTGAIAMALVALGHAQNVATPPSSVVFAGQGATLEEVPGLGPAAAPSSDPASSEPAAENTAPILQSLPRPPALPNSLLAPAPPMWSGFTGMTFPYFVPDSLLDSPVRPPGWFSGAEVDILKVHLNPQLIVQSPADRVAGTFFQVNLPSAPLNWAASPRVFLGYRLPSGFGEISVVYRYLNTAGSTTAPILDGPTSLTSHLNFNMLDIDYSNSEFTPTWPDWEMKWIAGLRLLSLSYDSQAQQSAAQAAGGSGILTERIFNNTWGLGPHVALELNRHLRDPRWSLTMRADGASLFTFLHDGLQSTTLGPGSPPIYPNTTNKGHQETPMINLQAGLAWQPTVGSSTRIFVGYVYEHIWALNFVPPTGTNPPSTGQVELQGVVLRATLRY